ncbi:hypothetical protein MJ584_00415 [Klebsiella pneumoniae]|nr:hypothetical protein MJ584_00415 [Klebsiella pneumoniae]
MDSQPKTTKNPEAEKNGQQQAQNQESEPAAPLADVPTISQRGMNADLEHHEGR